MKGGVIGGGAATAAIAALTLRRLLRGRAVWVSVAIAAVPVVVATALGNSSDAWTIVMRICGLLLAILPPLHVASSLSEELEERTSVYLWCRPVARWTIVTGKIAALAPLIMALLVASALLAGHQLSPSALAAAGASGGSGAEGPPWAGVALGFALGALAASCAAAAFATLVPRHGMAVSICYLLIVDLPLGELPASIAKLSLTHHVQRLVTSHEIAAGSAIGLVAVAAAFLALALWRIGRIE
jgi:hypothetical protein